MPTIVKGGGVTESETLLWTNAAGTVAFAEQDVTLSESVNNFRKLRIEFKPTKSSSRTHYIEIPVYDNNGSYMYRTGSAGKAVFGRTDSSSRIQVRPAGIDENDSTIFHFYSSVQAGGTDSSNDNLVPLAIYGIK